jgi:hypothetical protein
MKTGSSVAQTDNGRELKIKPHMSLAKYYVHSGNLTVSTNK